MALREGKDPFSIRAAILKTGPFSVMPGVTNDKKVGSVLLEGRPWAYFDGKYIFLPRKKGIYNIKVRNGNPGFPHLAACSACVEGCSFRREDACLEIKVSKPPWFKAPLPERCPFYLLVRPEGWVLRKAVGAGTVETGSLAYPSRDLPAAREAGILLECFRPGKVKIYFKKMNGRAGRI